MVDLTRPEYAYLRRAGITQRELTAGHNTGDKVSKTMREYRRGALRSSSGERVTDRDQALAIGLSQQRRGGRS